MGNFVASVFLGIIGAGYVMYGRKAQNPVALVAGVLLCVFPYFVDGLVWTLLIGAALVAAPFFIVFRRRRQPATLRRR